MIQTNMSLLIGSRAGLSGIGEEADRSGGAAGGFFFFFFFFLSQAIRGFVFLAPTKRQNEASKRERFLCLVAREIEGFYIVLNRTAASAGFRSIWPNGLP
jgi:hypothetical protein